MMEMKTLTLNGVTYDSFVDKTARQDIANIKNSNNSSGGTRSPLQGKKILAIGDSFVRGALPEEDEWVSKIASRNNMTAYNYGRSGSPLASAPVQTYPAIVTNLSTITAQVTEVDYVVLVAGHNDANPDINGGTAIPIGENGDNVNTTFKGALNITINTLLAAYPTAKILFLTPFNRHGIEEPYAEAMKEICGIWCIPCFDNYHSSGISFQNTAQLAVYDLDNSLHLNEAGQERISELYESLLSNHLPVTYSLGGESVAEDNNQNNEAQFNIVQMGKGAFEALTTKSASTVYLVNGYGVFVGATCIVSSDMMDSSTEEPDPEATLVSISATYSGGSVPAGTSVTSLTGLSVIATYSDGSTTTVTGYTLSGTIAEGNNTITVSYGGKTTTFTVIGVGEVAENFVTNSVENWRYTKESDGQVRKYNRVTTAFILNVGDVVNFSDSSLWDTYKFAIGPGEHSHDTSFYGGGYQTGAYTMGVGGLHCVMIARKDNADIDADEMAYIAANVGYIRGLGDDDDENFQTETITHYDTIQGYPGNAESLKFTETTDGLTTIYCEAKPGDYYEVSRNSAVSTGDRFRLAFSASKPQHGLASITYYTFDNQLKGTAQAPASANYLMVYVGGTSYPTIPDGFTIVRKYK